MNNAEVTCKGSYFLNTACGNCSRCREERRKAIGNDLTNWEVGQELIAIQDEIFGRIGKFKMSHPEAHNVARKAALDVGDYFNALGSHGFKIASHAEDLK